MINLAIVLVNYNHARLTIECINSIVESEQYDNYEIIVVDNNSPDGSANELKKRDDIRLICAKDNRGFAAGSNIGIRYAMNNGYDAVLLLNNDTIIDSHMLSKLISQYDGSTVLSPVMFYSDEPNKIWYAGGHIDRIRARAVHERIGKKTYKCRDWDKTIDFLTGCCMLIPISIIRRVGLFDEDFFMYYEDVDYSLKLKQLGVNMKCIPSAHLWHKVGASSGKKSAMNAYYDTRNRLYVIQKYRFGILAYVYFYSGRWLRIVLSWIMHDGMAKHIAKGMRDYHRGIRGKVDCV